MYQPAGKNGGPGQEQVGYLDGPISHADWLFISQDLSVYTWQWLYEILFPTCISNAYNTKLVVPNPCVLSC